jgi:RNA polymerase sigma-70 factor (ECF subfamily)
MEIGRRAGIDKESDRSLVAAAKRRETQAFEELVFRYEQRVLAIAQRITNNREDAEDVAQESFHKAFRHLDSFQEKARFSTWLTRIVMNEAYMLLRRRQRVVEVLPENEDDAPEWASPAFVDQRPSPEESCWRRERTELLTAAIDCLRPISAVKARLFHGRQKLRETVNPALLPEVYAAGRPETQRC